MRYIKTAFIMVLLRTFTCYIFEGYWKMAGGSKEKRRRLQKQPSVARHDKSSQHGFVPTPIIEKDNLHWCQGYREEEGVYN